MDFFHNGLILAETKNRMKNTIKGLTLVMLAGTLLFACNDDTTTPSAMAPSSLTYEPNSISTEEGVAVMSEEPSVDGTTPITYTITTSPAAGSDITIDKNSGVISASAATIGTFMVTVTATNEAGSKEFADALTIEVKAKVKITFKADIQPAIANSCKPCHVAGGGNTTYTEFAKASAGVDGILNRVNRDEGTAGFMPLNGTKLDAATLALIDQWKTDGLLEE